MSTHTPDPRPFHPDMAAAQRRVVELSQYPGDRTPLPVPEQRRLMEAERPWWNEEHPPFAREWSFSVPYASREVAVHAMQPPNQTTDQRPGGWIVWLHGGGWTLGSTATHGSLLRGLALATGRTVFSVEYALAPEHPFPEPVEETVSVLAQLRSRAAEWGLDPARMAIGGDSSGSNVALAAGLQLQREQPGAVRAGLFYYGVFDDDLATGAAVAYGDGSYGLSAARMGAYWDYYVPQKAQRTDGRVNLLHADLSAAFPMYVMAAECDVLRDGALRFARRLADAKLPHRLSLREGMGHAFMGFGRLVPDVQVVHGEAAAFLDEHA